MTTINTKSGYVQLIGSWGHGGPADREYASMPAVIIEDDGDGHYTAWRVRGRMRDAACAIAAIANLGDEPRLAVLTEGRYLEYLRSDEWAEGVEEVILDEDGEVASVAYHADRHPGGLLLVI